MKRSVLFVVVYVLVLISLSEIGVVMALRNVTLYIEPSIAILGSSSSLSCTYDLESDKLYSVKWYRGNLEFYRYSPGDSPALKYFRIPGIKVNTKKSNSTQVVIDDVDFNLAGNFSCEVTTDSPNIHARIDSKSMSVVDPPEYPPVINVGRNALDYGDTLHANCSSFPSSPPADLKFILNDITLNQTEPSALRPKSGWSDLQLDIKLSFIHFKEGRLILQCVADIHSVYHEVAELELETVRHPVPARVSAPSNSGARETGEFSHTIKLAVYFALFGFVTSQTCY